MSGPENRLGSDRRRFLQGTIGSAVLLASGSPVSALGVSGGMPRDRVDTFARMRMSDPRLAAFANAAPFEACSLQVEGTVPEGLAGVFYRNGPALFERDGERYRHWFDGDGFIQRWGIDASGISYRGRFVDTPKYRAEEQAGKFLLPVSGGGIRPGIAFAGSDSNNPSNTALLAVNGEIWALWEGGSPVRVDPRSLATGGHVDLGGRAKGAPFSAHPRVGADGRIWNVGSLGSKVILYRLAADGTLQQARVQALGQEGYYHDFILTARSVVLVQCSTASDGSQSLMNGSFGSIRGVPGKPMKVHVFDRETFDLVRQAELPAGFVFHFGNGWEEADGTIHFDIVHERNSDEMLEFFKPMSGAFPNWNAAAYSVVLPPKGPPRFDRLYDRVEFPTINPQVRTGPNRYVYTAAMESRGQSDWFDAVAKLDLDRGRNSLFRYGPGWMVEEHQFVPRAGGQGEDDGWLIGTALNWKLQRSALSIFDARHPDRGFLARAWLDRAMPLGLHAQFVAAGGRSAG